MKRIASIALAAILAFSLAACGPLQTVPTAPQVQRVQLACDFDAGIRPSVSALMIFATPAENAGIKAARDIIDPICANPTKPLMDAEITSFTSAVASVASYEAALQARKAAPPK